ncbi:hypothetical protein Droror1_Dr00000399, partial [Drosera rotundifolia]
MTKKIKQNVRPNRAYWAGFRAHHRLEWLVLWLSMSAGDDGRWLTMVDAAWAVARGLRFSGGMHG